MKHESELKKLHHPVKDLLLKHLILLDPAVLEALVHLMKKQWSRTMNKQFFFLWRRYIIQSESSSSEATFMSM